MDVDWKFVGGKELQSALDQLPKSVERKIGRQALRMGAKVLKVHIERRVPVDAITPDGSHLKDSVRIFRPRALRKNIALKVGYAGKAAIYGPLIEFGNSSIQPNPVWRRAVTEVGGEVVQKVITKLSTDIIKETKKLFKKTI